MENIIQMQLRGSFLIVLLLFFRYFFNHYVPKRFFVFLWIGVLVRLFFPIFIPVKWHINLLGHIGENRLIQPGVNRLQIVTQLEQVRPSIKLEAAASQKTAETLKSMEVIHSNNEAFPAMVLVWLIIAVLLAVIIFMGHFMSVRKYRMSLPVSTEITEKWHKSHHSIRKVRIRKSDQIDSPLTYGLFRPIILLPAAMDLDEESYTYILEHEWIHVQRCDVLIKYLMYFAVCFFWFNPLIWIMLKKLNRDMELACDEKVLKRHSGKSGEKYALLLLAMAEKQAVIWPVSACFTKQSEIEERIRLIMKRKKYTWKAPVIAAVIILCAAPIFTKAAQDQVNNDVNRTGQSSINTTEIGPELTPEPISDNTPESSPEQDMVSDTSVTGTQIAEWAKEQIGAPYNYGGTDLKTGVDCTGFVKVIYEKGGISLPSTMKELANSGTIVNIDEINAGDIIFYESTDLDDSVLFSHVAIYVGDGQVVHASNSRDGVKYSPFDYRGICFVIRVLNE